MKNWIWFVICALLGAAAVLCGLMVPVHLRAVDDTVLEYAAHEGPGFVGKGLALVYERNLGAAEMIARAARLQNIEGREKLEQAVADLAKEDPLLRKHGQVEESAAGNLLENSRSTARPRGESEPFAEFLIRAENREKALWHLERSPSAAVRQLLTFRSVTNTTLFPASQSSSGQALDAALAMTGLLMECGRISAPLSNSLVRMAIEATLGSSGPFEQALMDVLSISQRMNWGQLATFVSQIEDAETLRLQANLVRRSEERLPVLFAAVCLSANPAGVAKYLTTYGTTGMRDLGASLKYGAGMSELLQKNQRLNISKFQPLLLGWSLRLPWLALTVKWLLYFLGGFFVAVALHFALPAVPRLERPLQVSGFYFARAALFGLGALLVVLLLSEPFLAQESQKVEFPLRLQLPVAGSAAPAEPAPVTVSTFMNPEVLITMLIFFVLQSLLYIACLLKLAEIRRQRVGPRIKLRLLENEEHLFDSGLYLGFLGTIISLILVSLGVFKQPSLMAAYSATCFGILFVVLFKVAHLRPTRRKLLLEAEATPAESAPAANPFAAPL